MFDIFGSEMPLPAKFFIAFAAVLALIGVTAWLVRRFAADRLGGANTRGRQPRLAVIDATAVDARRRLVLIRRDNVEHLMMIGGPTDVVVEQNIVRAAPAAPRLSDTPRAAEPVARQPAAPDTFPLQPVSESAPLPPPRPYRAPATEEPWHAPEPGARARPATAENSLSGLAAELSSRIAPPESRAEAPRFAAPQPMAPPPAAPVATAPAAPPVAAEHEPGEAPQSDQNLADMAHQLEAALRRAPAENRGPVPEPYVAPAPKPVDVPRRDYKLRVDPRIENPAPARTEDDAWPEPAFEAPRAEPRPEARYGRAEPRPAMPPTRPAAPAGKAVYDSLEQEMANLLGRPPGKT